MAKIKVLLEKGETSLDADLALQKALELHTSGDVHARESFDDPAMQDVSKKLEAVNKVTYANMIKEIIAALEEDYRGNL